MSAVIGFLQLGLFVSPSHPPTLADCEILAYQYQKQRRIVGLNRINAEDDRGHNGESIAAIPRSSSSGKIGRARAGLSVTRGNLDFETGYQGRGLEAIVIHPFKGHRTMAF